MDWARWPTAWAADRRLASDFTVVGRGGNGLSRSPFFIRQIFAICPGMGAVKAWVVWVVWVFYFVPLPEGGGTVLL